MERNSILYKGAHFEMEKDAIIFFDTLGFGWVVDPVVVKEMRLDQFKEDRIFNKSLIQILENLFDTPLI